MISDSFKKYKHFAFSNLLIMGEKISGRGLTNTGANSLPSEGKIQNLREKIKKYVQSTLKNTSSRSLPHERENNHLRPCNWGCSCALSIERNIFSRGVKKRDSYSLPNEGICKGSRKIKK